MSEELIKQRVRYLIEHGGIYPPDNHKLLLALVIWCLGVSVLELIAELGHYLTGG